MHEVHRALKIDYTSKMLIKIRRNIKVSFTAKVVNILWVSKMWNLSQMPTLFSSKCGTVAWCNICSELLFKIIYMLYYVEVLF